ncbi:MAG: FAD-binding oxidoreductase, partial [Hypericibacter sp.]
MLKRRDGTPVDKTGIKGFKKDFRGQVILPGSADYDPARRIWNASIDKHPGLIARCSDVDDVLHAVRFARANDLLVAVRGGGHNVGGRALCDDGIVIDLSALKSITVDPQARTVRVAPGVLLSELDRATHPHGLAVPAGVVSRTGIAGLALGGGIGWISRKYGLTSDNLLSCDVVTARGELVTADAKINPDLFWGLRGGGGNFGVVTSFQFRAHPVSTVLGGLLLHSRDQAGMLLRHYRALMATAPDELTAFVGFLPTPDGQPAVAAVACYCGDIAEGERILAPLRAFGSPMVDTIQPIPFPVMQTLADESNPDHIQNYWRSTFIETLSDEVIDLIVDQAGRAESSLSITVLGMLGGAIGRVDTGETAFAHRKAAYN